MARTTNLESRSPAGRPAAPSSISPNDETSEPPRQIRRSWLGKLFGGIGWMLSGPVDWADTKSIARAGALIRGLSIAARSRWPRNFPLQTGAQGRVRFDCNGVLLWLVGARAPASIDRSTPADGPDRVFDVRAGVCGPARVVQGRADVAVDICTGRPGARFSAVLRVVLSDRVLQCADQFSDQDASGRWLARVSDDERRILAALSTATSFHQLLSAICRSVGDCVIWQPQRPRQKPPD